MVRFILKSAFFLGVVAMLLPGRDLTDDAASNDFDVFSVFAGLQAAVSDLAGFCERAPAACDTGGAFARFAGERISDGFVLAYNLAGAEHSEAPEVRISAVPPASWHPDTMVSGAVDRAVSLTRPTPGEASTIRALPSVDNQRDLRHVAVPSPSIPANGISSRLPVPRAAPRP